MSIHNKQMVSTKYLGTKLVKVLEINTLYSLFYFERSKDYVFEGECHDFWEFLYVDKGEVEVMADTEGYKLEQGDIIFHKPNEFHSVWANKKISPNLVVISFECHSPAMSCLENKIYSLNIRQLSMLSQIVKEGRVVFSNYDNEEWVLVKNHKAPFGYEQLLKNHIEEFLIDIINNGNNQNKEGKLYSVMKERVEEDLINKILDCMKRNLYCKLDFKDICRLNMASETHLKVLFKKRMGESVMKYFKILKIEESKKLIREGKYTITQISDMLGYSTVHLFSRNFKEITSMTPTEYAASINAWV